MSRMENQALTALVESSEAAGYTLPPELLDAYRTYRRVREVKADIPAPLDVDTVAARIVSAVAAGEDPGPLDAARNLDETTAARATAESAQRILGRATEQAAEAATNLAADLAERIITEHLRPAFEQVHDEAREVAAALDGYGLDAHTLIKAPAKARNAFLRLPELVNRKAAILDARKRVNAIGHRTPEHDAQGLFATFREPMRFFPTWRHPARIPMLPFPEDATERLLWIVGPEAKAAEPWLPTVAEQDAAWLAQFEANMPKSAPWARLVANA